MNRTIRVVGKIALAAAAGAVIGALIARRVPHLAEAHLNLPPGIKISLALWVLFSIYWSIAAKDSAPTRSSESTGSRQLHLILVNIALLVLVFPVPGLTRRFLPASEFFVVAGLIVQAAFIYLAVWARHNLGSNWSGEVRIAREHQLVRSGPYRFIRHPIYTGVLGMYCGTALVSGQIHALVALAMVALAYWRKIRMEEKALSETFGAEFESYRRNTWALVPLLY